MGDKEILVWRVEYEKIPSMSSWTAFVAGHSAEEAEKFISMLVGPIRTSTIGMQCKLDAVSYEVRDKIVNAYLGRSKDVTVNEVSLITKKSPKKK